MTHSLRLAARRLGGPALLVASLLAARPAAAQWTTQNSGLPAASGVGSISIVDASTVWAAGYSSGASTSATYNTFTRTTNGGSTWAAGTIAAAASYSLTSIGAASSAVAWATSAGSTGGGYLYYTADGGATWARQLSTGFPQASGGFANGVLAFSTTSAVVVGDPLTTTGTFEAYTTTNAGTTWTAATTPARLSGEYGLAGTVTTVAGSTATTRACWMGTTAGRVLRSTDSGATWTAAVTGLDQVTSLAFCSTATGLALNNNAPNMVAYTTDGGATWTTRTPTGPFYTSGLAGVSGLANGFVSTGSDNNGVGSSYSLDGGTTWTALDAGPAHTAVAFLNATTGWSGGFVVTAGTGGLYKGTLPTTALATPAAQPLASLSVYPNPATDAFTVTVPAVAGTIQVQATLLNALGQAVARQETALPAAGTDLSFSVSGLAAGLYTLRVQAGTALVSQRVSVR